MLQLLDQTLDDIKLDLQFGQQDLCFLTENSLHRWIKDLRLENGVDLQQVADAQCQLTLCRDGRACLLALIFGEHGEYRRLVGRKHYQSIVRFDHVRLPCFGRGEIFHGDILLASFDRSTIWATKRFGFLGSEWAAYSCSCVKRLRRTRPRSASPFAKA